MQDIENIKCPKCGTVVIKGTKKCIKCHTNLDTTQKSCPKCAKRNDINAKKCIRCGYNFNLKNKSLVFNIVISVLLVIILLILEYKGLLSKINISLKILAGFFIALIVYGNFTRGRKDIVKYNEDAISTTPTVTKRMKRMKRISSIIIILAGIIILITLISIYLSKR